MTLATSLSVQKMPGRSVEHREADALTLRAIAQAAVSVELFTIPLYMGALYSIYGMHQITGEREDFYAGRWWPGLAPTAPREGKQLTSNQWAFNLIFSVFIEEMLHLQMAANIASAIGVCPIFTGSPLQTNNYGWQCYGPNETMIPHIVDLRDTTKYDKVTVNIAALTINQVDLFRAIEEPEPEKEEDVRKNFKDDPDSKYVINSPRANHSPVPFDKNKNWKEPWKPGKTVEETVKILPMFGTIGSMYQCYLDYMSLPYDDGTTLWDYVFTPEGQQNDMFNLKPELRIAYPQGEYGFTRALTGISSNNADAFRAVKDMMNAITDQGEGNMLKLRPPEEMVGYAAVEEKYRADRGALEQYYPSYDETGKKMELSAHAVARCDNDGTDHYERFGELLERLKAQKEIKTWEDWPLGGEKDITTWEDWHRTHKNTGNGPWKGKYLQPEGDTTKANKYGVPCADDIAAAMNKIHHDQKMYKRISQAAVGSIAGITTVLNDYWAKPDVTFPYPSMVGSGDRLAICWALFGKAPDLSSDIDPVKPGTLYHACQSLDFQKPETDEKGHACAQVAVFHSCRGSNKCMAQGGCGFVQQSNVHPPGQTSQQPPFLYSAPGDNQCAAYGGCAVPISDSQILPKEGVMELFDFDVKEPTPQPLLNAKGEPLTISFTRGEKVYDVAYRAYREVMKKRQEKDSAVQVPPEQLPKPSNLRLAFPPST